MRQPLVMSFLVCATACSSGGAGPGGGGGSDGTGGTGGTMSTGGGDGPNGGGGPLVGPHELTEARCGTGAVAQLFTDAIEDSAWLNIDLGPSGGTDAIRDQLNRLRSEDL